jgi:hypothetical protein
MKTKRIIHALAAVVALFTGCVVQSLHPLFTEKDFTPCPDLVGTWVQQDNGRVIGTWSFTPDGARYDCAHTDENGRKARFHVAAGRIGTNVFLQGSLRDSDNPLVNDLATLHLISSYLFVKAVFTNNSLSLLAMDVEWLTGHLGKNPQALPHVLRDKRPILTASSEELKAFVAKHANDPAAFKNEIKLTPAKAP